MEHFYITLHSDGSKDIFPNNTAAKFKKRLTTSISLVGDWDVALYEIHYKRLWHAVNAIDSEIIYEINSPSTHRASLYLFLGYYTSIEDVVQALNNIFNYFKIAQKLASVPTFGYNSRTRRIFIELQPGESLQFKPELATLLGLTTDPIHCGNESRKYHAEEIVNLDETIHTLYVNCIIIENKNMPVGGMEAPLLRIVGVDTKQEEIVRTTYDNPMYVPVRIKKFDTIELNIKSNTGEHAPFQHSKSEVILLFRKQSGQTCLTFM